MKDSGFNKKGLCRLCKEPRTREGHDPCIANLPGVLFACCGHGQEEGYIKFEDGRRLVFKAVEVELDIPEYEVVAKPVPVYVRGALHRVLNFKTGKKQTKVGAYQIQSMAGGPIEVMRRKS